MAVFNPVAENKPRYTEEEIADIVQWFDDNSTPSLTVNDEPVHVITVEQLQLFLDLKKYHERHFHYPSYGEIMNEIEALHMEKFRALTKEQLIYLLDKWALVAEIKPELKLAFQVFDIYKHNYLEIEEAEAALKNFGDKFSKVEFIEFLRDANMNGTGKIDYNGFVDNIFRLQPELYNIETSFLFTDPEKDPRFIVTEEIDPEIEPVP